MTLVKKCLLGAAVASVVAGTSLGVFLYYRYQQLPTVQNLKQIEVKIPLKIYTYDGKLLGEYGEVRRSPLSVKQMPPLLVKAFVAAEDDEFFEHSGVDFKGILRSIYINLKTRRKAQGASTITMQLARNYYLTKKKSWSRKRDEVLLAWKIEREFNKDEIIELYLNKIYLGNRAYGIGAAAQVYYGKDVEELTLAQMAMIAGLPKAPSLYNPIANPKRALKRRNYVLKRMLDLEIIGEKAYQQALAFEDNAIVHTRHLDVDAYYVAESVRQALLDEFGELITHKGYKVYTTIDARMQQAANRAIRKGLIDYDQRYGYRGPIDQVVLSDYQDEQALALKLSEYPVVNGIHPVAVLKSGADGLDVFHPEHGELSIPATALAWAMQEGDKVSWRAGDIIQVERIASTWVLAQTPQVEGSLLAMAPDSGGIKAMVGGFDYFRSKFNRATQALRQPGSNFKPFLYSAYLAQGHSPATLVNDMPLNIPGWPLAKPPFMGNIRLRVGLAHSRNLVAARILRQMGVATALTHVKGFGFNTEEMPHNLTLALGSAEVSQLGLVQGYAVFANGGYRVSPYLIERIEDAHGNEIFAQPGVERCEDRCYADIMDDTGLGLRNRHTYGYGAPRVISEENAFLTTHMLQSVIQEGTGRRALKLDRPELAGKTGTTDQQKDAWFTGYNQSLVASVWVGFDKPESLGPDEYGSKAALPVWIDFMQAALKSHESKPWSIPNNIVSVKIDPKTGLLAPVGLDDYMWEYFEEGTQPGAYASLKQREEISEQTNPYF